MTRANSPPEGPAGRDELAKVVGDERLFQAIFEHTFQFMCLLAPDGTLLEANRAILDFTGLMPDAVIGRPFWEILCFRDSTEKQNRVRAAIREAARGGFVRYEVELAGRDGRRAIVDLSLSPVRDDGNAVTFVLAEGRDVTGMRLAERERRVTEEKFRNIVSISSDAIISVDADQRIIHFNQGAEQTFGWEANEVLGQRLEILLPERFREIHHEHVRRFAASPVAARRMGERQEISGLRRGGIEFPADASISKTQVDGNWIFTVVLRDITARKRAEQLQRFLAEAGALLGSSLDLETTLRSISRLGVKSFADYCAVHEAMPHGHARWVEVAHTDPDKDRRLANLRGLALPATHPALSVIETGEAELARDVTESYIEAIAADAEHRSILRELAPSSAMIVPLIALGRTLGAITFFSSRPESPFGDEDLVFAKELASRAALALQNARLYQEARDAVRARDDVLAVVSHDLGNPLSAIRIGTSLLLRSVPHEERTGAWKHIEGIRQSVEQMERLIKDLLEVKRIEAGHLTLDRERHAPSALLREVVELFEPIAEGKAQRLETHVSPAVPAVMADRERTLQVFSNLVGNALKFTPEGGRITVAAAVEGDGVVFSVSDTGRGIDPADLEHVFDRFWQAHRNKREGIGLGLAIVKGIVQAHGGRVWARSEPGAGSTFFFTLPAVQPDGRAAPTHQPTTA
ncbi:MAG: sensor histidine kinase [Longimicrobiales bacterium]